MTATLETIATPENLQTVMIARKLIRPLPQPRTDFDLSDLIPSLVEHGFTLSTMEVRKRPGRYFIEKDEALSLWNFCFEDATGQVHRQGTHEREGEAERQLEHEGQPYEIVSGERRWRGSTQLAVEKGDARFEHLPCRVVTCDDLALAKRRMAENVARNDLDPIEEANGFAQILRMEMAAQGDACTRVYALDVIAKGIGCSRERIRQRLFLINLPEEAREAVCARKLFARTATLIGALPTEEMRVKATKEILHPSNAIGPISFKAAQLYIQTHIAKDLRKAEFSKDDPQLVAEERDEQGQRTSGGACTDCPLRAGNSPEIYGEDTHPDLCMNPGCFALKENAKWVRWEEEQTNSAKNRRGVSREEFDSIAPQKDGQVMMKGRTIVRLVDRPADTLLAEGQNVSSWKQIVKGSEVPILVVPDDKGRPVEYVDAELAIAAAQTAKNPAMRSVAADESAAGHRKDRSEDGHRDATMRQKNEQTQQRAADEAQEREADERMRRVIDHASRGKVIPAAVWDVFADILTFTVDEHGDACDMAKARGMSVPHKDAQDEGTGMRMLRESYDNLPPAQKIGFVFELVLMCEYKVARAGRVNGLAEAYDLDLRKEEKPVTEAIEKLATESERTDGKDGTDAVNGSGEKKPEASCQLPELPKGMEWVKPPKETGFVWNEHGVCENPDELRLTLPKKPGGKLTLSVAYAQNDGPGGVWYSGLNIEMGKKVNLARGPKLEGWGFENRWRALCSALSDSLVPLSAERSLKQTYDLVNAYVLELAGISQ